MVAEHTGETTTTAGARARPGPLGWLRRTFGRHPDEEALLAQIEDPDAFRVGACILALVVAAAGATFSLLFDDGHDVYNVAVIVTTVVPWALGLFGVTLPRPVFAAWVLLPSAALMVADWFVGTPPWNTATEFSFGREFAMFLILLMLADCVSAPRPQTLAITVVSELVIVGRFVTEGDVFDVVIWSLGVGFVTAAGIGVRYSSVALIRARDALAAQKASEERRQIARDVHDVVAHTLAVTMLHMTAARMAVQRSAPQDAVEALEEAERHGRASLADVRRIIRVLRADDESALDAAQPDLADIGALVDRYRSAGLRVELHARGSTETVSAGTGLAVFRVTQEALANAARHGDGGVTVDLRVGDGEVTVRVVNPATRRRSTSDGHGTGVMGMRERVLAAGGTLSAGMHNGTWVVQAALPVAQGDASP